MSIQQRLAVIRFVPVLAIVFWSGPSVWAAVNPDNAWNYGLELTPDEGIDGIYASRSDALAAMRSVNMATSKLQLDDVYNVTSSAGNFVEKYRPVERDEIPEFDASWPDFASTTSPKWSYGSYGAAPLFETSWQAAAAYMLKLNEEGNWCALSAARSLGAIHGNASSGAWQENSTHGRQEWEFDGKRYKNFYQKHLGCEDNWGTYGITTTAYRNPQCDTSYTLVNDTGDRLAWCRNNYTAEIRYQNIHGTVADTGRPEDCPAPFSISGFVGNPCDASTGEKVETAFDYRGIGIEFARTYRSHLFRGKGKPLYTESGDPAESGTDSFSDEGWPGHMGVNWVHNYEPWILFQGTDPLSNTPHALVRPDGSLIPLAQVGGTNRWVGRNSSGVVLDFVIGVENDPDDDEWIVRLPTGEREVYRSGQKPLAIDFRLEELHDREGLVTSVAYDSDGYIDTVTGPFGHQLTFAYTSPLSGCTGVNCVKSLQRVTDPAGGQILFDYDSVRCYSSASSNIENVLLPRLSTVTYPDLSVATYKYSDPLNACLLTGIEDGNQDQYATWTYDASGRVASSHHGVSQVYQRVDLTYGADASNNEITTVTDAANYSTVFEMQSHANIRAISRKTNSADGAFWQQTNDSNTMSNLTELIDPLDRSTKFDHELTNGIFQLGQLTLADGTADEREIAYTYLNTDSRIIETISEPSVKTGSTNKKVTTLGYVSGTQWLSGITVTGYRSTDGAAISRTTALSCHNSAGQPRRFDGPRLPSDVNDVIEMAYWGDQEDLGSSCPTSGPSCSSNPGACGQVYSVTRLLPTGNHVTYYSDYDAHGRPTSITNPRGTVTTITYDGRGHVNVVTATPTTGAAMVYEYDHDAAGLLDTVTLPSGLVLNYEWKDAHLVDFIVDNAGNKIDYEYDSRGNISDIDFADGGGVQQTLAMAYDARNQLESLQVGSAGLDTRTTFDAVGNLRFVKDDYGTANAPVERTAQIVYDELNRPKSSIDPQSLTTNYLYDRQDNLREITVPKSSSDTVKTKYFYDDFGNLLKEESPDRGTTLYSYDEAGNLTCRLDGRYSSGVTDCLTANGRVAFTYDALNRQTGVLHAQNSSEDVQLVYDVWANPGDLTFIKRVNRDDWIWSIFNKFGNITGQWDYIDNGGGGVESLQTLYGYDSHYNLQTVTYPKPHPSESTGRVVTYNRDALGRVVGITATFKGQNYTVINGDASNPGVLYKPFGPATQVTFGNGVTQDWLYDDAYGIDRVTVKNSSNTTLLDWDYTLDAAGNVQSINKNGTTTNYAYSIVDRLTQDGATAYGFDGNGNVTQAGYVSLSYAANTNRLATQGAANVQHDGMGNVTANGGIVTFGYDAGGRLNTLTRSPAGQPVQTVTNQYNGKGERSFTHRVLSPTERYVEYYTYAEDGRLLTFVQSVQNTDDSLGTRTVYNYIWLENIPVAQFRERYSSSGAHIDSQLTYIHADHLYTPTLGTGYSAATQNNQTVVWSLWSNAWGYAFPNNDPDNDKLLTGGSTVDIALRLPGQVYYGVGAYNYNYYRDYDTITGRYLESDPIGLAGGTNTYAYVGGNPLKYSDSNGLIPDPVDAVFIAYDLYRLARDNLYYSCDNLNENLLALGVDFGGLFLPGGGLSLGVRGVDNAGGVVAARTIPWSSKAVRDAAKALQSGATDVRVASRSQAEELFLGRYQGSGYRNTSGMSPREAKDIYGGKAGTYHWDTGAGAYPHGSSHLQIHTHEGQVVRIFFPD